MTEQQKQAYRAMRKAVSARYYQRNRDVIKIAMSLRIPMREARRLTGKHGRWPHRAEMEICSDWRLSDT
jgi:hypothetical protein